MKLLPLTVTFVIMLLAIKVAAVVRGGEEVARMFMVPMAATAQDEAAKPAEKSEQKKPEEKKAEEKPAADKPEEKKTEEKPAAEGASSSSSGTASSSGEGDKPKEDAPAEGHGEAPAAEGEGHGGGEGDKPSEKKPVLQGHVAKDKPDMGEEGGGRGLAPGARYFSPVELDVLQNLSKRHEQLNNWQKDLEVKENLLSDVERRIDGKVGQMEGMQKALKELIVQYDDQENTKIKSLVKIYENMKPRDAARIFDEVELPILLLVIDKMAEKKVAPILAGMDSKKAKQLTVSLAEQRRLQANQIGACPPAAAPIPPTNTLPPAAGAPAAR